MAEQHLNGWKEIASYLGRGVRTVQRWEADLGLPVRRPRGKDRSAVIALASELDRWLVKAPSRVFDDQIDDNGEGDEEIVICPAQVLVAKEKGKKVGFDSSMDMDPRQSSMSFAGQDSSVAGGMI